jgi:hypothetical protein
MKFLIALTFLSLTLVGCSEKPPAAAPPPQVALPDRLQSRFEDYCDYTGDLGIGFVAWHTYDYRFRQYLKRTQDPELKRLYVLENLHRDTEHALDDLEKGIMRTGKASSRPLTAGEWQAARQRISEQIEDLAKYTAFTNYAVSTRDLLDSPDPHLMFWIDDLRQVLSRITNAPGADPQGAANRSQPVRPETNRPSTAAVSNP